MIDERIIKEYELESLVVYMISCCLLSSIVSPWLLLAIFPRVGAYFDVMRLIKKNKRG